MAKGLFLNRKYYDVWLDLPLVTACSKGLEEVESLIRKKNDLDIIEKQTPLQDYQGWDPLGPLIQTL